MIKKQIWKEEGDAGGGGWEVGMTLYAGKTKIRMTADFWTEANE